MISRRTISRSKVDKASAGTAFASQDVCPALKNGPNLMNDDTSESNGPGDLLLLISGCVGIFLGVFYFDQISNAVSTQYQSLMAEWSRPAPAIEQSPSPVAQSAASSSERSVFLKADRYNQFFADAYVNGRRINVLVDTGASHVSLNYEDARALGFYLSKRDFTHSARTANGETRVAPVRIDRIRIGEVEVRDIDGFVGEEGIEFPTLLGMTFLRKLGRMNIRGRQLQLVQ